MLFYVFIDILSELNLQGLYKRMLKMIIPAEDGRCNLENNTNMFFKQWTITTESFMIFAVVSTGTSK